VCVCGVGGDDRRVALSCLVLSAKKLQGGDPLKAIKRSDEIEGVQGLGSRAQGLALRAQRV
jgi:hypothetical protein